MNFKEFAAKSGEWLRGIGPQSDIVISSRIRLARNLADFPFIRWCADIDRANIAAIARERLFGQLEASGLSMVDVAELDDLDRQFLVERQLISRELSDSDGARCVMFDKEEKFSLMVNEEDHLRIQVMTSGLDLASAWERIDAIDDKVEESLTYAYHPDFGYLTACPTNVGTGMRVSVMLHLPALVITRQVEKVFRSLQKISLAVRGLYGEGSHAMGDFYQISNQITLGKTEEELLEQVGEVVPVLISYERKARDFLMEESQNDLKDQIRRAYGVLRSAQQISSEETLHLLSKVRMGVNLDLIPDVEIGVVNKLCIHTQPAHLQKLCGRDLSSSERNVERAKYLQSHLRELEGNGETSTRSQ